MPGFYGKVKDDSNADTCVFAQNVICNYALSTELREKYTFLPPYARPRAAPIIRNHVRLFRQMEQ